MSDRHLRDSRFRKKFKISKTKNHSKIFLETYVPIIWENCFGDYFSLKNNFPGTTYPGYFLWVLSKFLGRSFLFSAIFLIFFLYLPNFSRFFTKFYDFFFISWNNDLSVFILTAHPCFITSRGIYSKKLLFWVSQGSGPLFCMSAEAYFSLGTQHWYRWITTYRYLHITASKCMRTGQKVPFQT